MRAHNYNTNFDNDMSCQQNEILNSRRFLCYGLSSYWAFVVIGWYILRCAPLKHNRAFFFIA